MATNAQILANQANSKRSTGPRTPEGKAAVSRNAVKHGIFYYAIADDTPQYQDLVAGLFEALKPQDELQRMLVEQIAVTIVRLKRLVRHEDRYLECVDYDAETGAPYSAVGAYIASGTAALTTRYENSLNRLLQRLLRAYGEMRDDEGWVRLRNFTDPSPYLISEGAAPSPPNPPAEPDLSHASDPSDYHIFETRE